LIRVFRQPVRRASSVMFPRDSPIATVNCGLIVREVLSEAAIDIQIEDFQRTINAEIKAENSLWRRG
jgi:hypothetical protein